MHDLSYWSLHSDLLWWQITHYVSIALDLWLKVMHPWFTHRDQPGEKTIWICFIQCNQLSATVSLMSFWIGVNSQGTHLAHTLLMLKSLWIILYTDPYLRQPLQQFLWLLSDGHRADEVFNFLGMLFTARCAKVFHFNPRNTSQSALALVFDNIIACTLVTKYS